MAALVNIASAVESGSRATFEASGFVYEASRFAILSYERWSLSMFVFLHLQPKVTQTWMVIGATPKGPVILAISFAN